MAKSVYLISEAAKEVCVENHVLRYWEEELALPVKRNSQGHRYYTMEDLNTFKRIKYLKEQGLQLKAIKLFLSKEKTSFVIHQGDKVTSFCKETSQHSMTEQDTSKPHASKSDASKPDAAGQEKSVKLIIDGDGSLSAPKPVKNEDQMQQGDRNEKAQKLQMILKLMVEEALREYDSDLKEDMKGEISGKLCADVRDAVIKEMDYQFRMQEEREEKRGQEREERDQELLRRIDEILRAKKPEKADKTGNFGKPENPEKTKKKKQGIFQWKTKSSLS